MRRSVNTLLGLFALAYATNSAATNSILASSLFAVLRLSATLVNKFVPTNAGFSSPERVE